MLTTLPYPGILLVIMISTPYSQGAGVPKLDPVKHLSLPLAAFIPRDVPCL